MGIVAVIQEALRIGRAHKSLWLFGFFVGLGIGGGGGGGGDGVQAPTPPLGPPRDPDFVLPIVLIVLALVVGFFVLKLVSAGALIEGVKRARRNVALTVREGFREGWAHWGVLFRIAVLYLIATLTSLALLAAPVALVGRLSGDGPALVVAVVLAVVGVPWLATLYMWRAFAERVAVLEDRHALDAIRKARLFLHGRLLLGLKLLVASFLGVLFVGLLGLAVGAPVVLLIRASLDVLGEFGAVALGGLMLMPLIVVVIAMIGIVTSSVWTIGYLEEVEP